MPLIVAKRAEKNIRFSVRSHFPAFSTGNFLGFLFFSTCSNDRKRQIFCVATVFASTRSIKASPLRNGHHICLSLFRRLCLPEKEPRHTDFLIRASYILMHPGRFTKSKLSPKFFPAFDSDGKTTRMLGKEGQESDGNYAEFLVAVRRVRCAHF